jgi:hypothetical protein
MKCEPQRGFIFLERKDASSVAPGRAFPGREVRGGAMRVGEIFSLGGNCGDYGHGGYGGGKHYGYSGYKHYGYGGYKHYGYGGYKHYGYGGYRHHRSGGLLGIRISL